MQDVTRGLQILSSYYYVKTVASYVRVEALFRVFPVDSGLACSSEVPSSTMTSFIMVVTDRWLSMERAQ